MLTAVAATMLTLAATTTEATKQPAPTGAAGVSTTTLATVLPPPGAWALMAMGCLALVRSKRVKR